MGRETGSGPGIQFLSWKDGWITKRGVVFYLDSRELKGPRGCPGAFPSAFLHATEKSKGEAECEGFWALLSRLRIVALYLCIYVCV